ncbi:MAG: DUF4342 domain-containing protein [Leptolyngbyaceae cyanobacterium SL_1_1]|nr:DUF4342 domain-containing protein [Leptolyngbyaceae cyanobacterium RM1_1_2]NJO09611.1 DUF4342 domain-containing protein [Leptolyngbyaceae cyanobacterium SL_1_1]
MDPINPQTPEPVDIPVKTIPSVDPPIPPGGTAAESFTTEEFIISGDTLVAKVKELIHESNIRRIIIKNEEGRVLIEIPLTVGVVGGVVSAAVFPVIAAVGVIGAMVAHLTLVIERRD